MCEFREFICIIIVTVDVQRDKLKAHVETLVASTKDLNERCDVALRRLSLVTVVLQPCC
jgi:hypothetical protein